MPTEYVADYEELTGRERDGTVRNGDSQVIETKVVDAPVETAAETADVVVETA